MSGNPFAISKGPNTLWGRAVAITPAMPQGQVLVGAFKTGGQLFRHGPISFNAIYILHHYFINYVAICAEIRAQLALFQPAARVCIVSALWAALVMP